MRTILTALALLAGPILGPAAWSSETSVGAWYRAQETNGEHPQDRIETLLARNEWTAAAAACREWLDRDPTAAFPMRVLAELHERAGHLLTARGLAMRAAHLYFDEAGKPSLTAEHLLRRIDARILENPDLPVLTGPYAGDLKYLRRPDATDPAAAPAPASAVAAIPATTIAPAPAQPAKQPAATPVAQQTPPAPKPAAAAPVPAKPAPPELKGEAQYLADPTGQWATSAVASSEYGKERYNAMQATGAPDVAGHRDDPRAWCPSATSGRIEWLELSYAKPVKAREVRVRQSHMPGAIVKIEGLTPEGATHVLWQGPDTQAYPAGEVGWLVAKAAAAPRIARIRVTLDLDRKPGWKQIDAVQLVGE